MTADDEDLRGRIPQPLNDSPELPKDDAILLEKTVDSVDDKALEGENGDSCVPNHRRKIVIAGAILVFSMVSQLV